MTKKYELIGIAIALLFLLLSTVLLRDSIKIDSVLEEGDELTNYQVDPSDIIQAEPLIEPIAASSLTSAEVEDIRYMREEEKLAYDLYTTLFSLWNVPIFQNIAQSEFSHMAAMQTLMDRYGLRDTAVGTVGIFTDPALQTIYDEWLAEGSESLAAALTIGARVEDVDIKDLQTALERTDNADITAVYENLLRGSRNHLRAFNRQIEVETGEPYIPQYISAEQFAEIIADEIERGPRSGRQ